MTRYDTSYSRESLKSLRTQKHSACLGAPGGRLKKVEEIPRLRLPLITFARRRVK